MDAAQTKKPGNQHNRGKGRGRGGEHWRGRGKGGRGKRGQNKAPGGEDHEPKSMSISSPSSESSDMPEQHGHQSPGEVVNFNQNQRGRGRGRGGQHWRGKGQYVENIHFRSPEPHFRDWEPHFRDREPWYSEDYPPGQDFHDYHYQQGRGRPPLHAFHPSGGRHPYHCWQDYDFDEYGGAHRGREAHFRGHPSSRGGSPRNAADMYEKGKFFSQEQLCSDGRGRWHGRGEPGRGLLGNFPERRGNPGNVGSMSKRQMYKSQDVLNTASVDDTACQSPEKPSKGPQDGLKEQALKAKPQQGAPKGKKVDNKPKDPTQTVMSFAEFLKVDPLKSNSMCSVSQDDASGVNDGEATERTNQKKKKQKKQKNNTENSQEPGACDDSEHKDDTVVIKPNTEPQKGAEWKDEAGTPENIKQKQLKKKGKQSISAKNDTPSDSPNKQKDDTESSKPTLREPDEMEIFNTLLKLFDGVASLVGILETTLFPKEWTPNKVLRWFQGRRKKFATFACKKEEDSTVSVYYSGPTFCIGFSSKKGKCMGEPCRFLHVCRDYMMGHCLHGKKCKFPHDLKSSHNQAIIKDNGLDPFSDHEILRILELSTPRVCRDYNEEGCNAGESCKKLHICERFVRNSCLKTSGDCLNHDRDSHQCKTVLKAYHLENHPKAFLYTDPEPMKRKPMKSKESKPSPRLSQSTDPTSEIEFVEECETVDRQESGHRAADLVVRGEFKFDEMDEQRRNDPDIPKICEAHLRGKCYENEGCRLHHYTLPYLWQICLDAEEEDWVAIDRDTNQKIEQAFCKPYFKNKQVLLTYGILTIDFASMRATMETANQNRRVHIRRLSTDSYVHVKEADGDTLATQWRWYWQDNNSEDSSGKKVENWMMYEQDGGSPYQSVIEAKFIHGQEKYIFQHGKFIYTLNLSDMYQENWETGKKRMVIRRPLFFHNQCLPSPPSRQPTHMDEIPSHWFPIDTASDYEMIPLNASSPQYETAEQKFLHSIDSDHYQVKHVYQVQNPYQWHKYCSKKKFLLDRLGRDLNEKQLFHGSASFEVIKAICKQSFDARVSGKNAVVYGDGCYFATTAKYSNNYTNRTADRQYMFLAKVLVGRYTQGQRGLKRPPSMNPAKLDSDLYNSCVDNTVTPTIFVTFDHDQCYPEFLIEYEQTNREHAPPRPVPTKSGSVASPPFSSFTTQPSKPQNQGISVHTTQMPQPQQTGYSTSTTQMPQPLQTGYSTSTTQMPQPLQTGYSTSTTQMPQPQQTGYSTSTTQLYRPLRRQGQHQNLQHQSLPTRTTEYHGFGNQQGNSAHSSPSAINKDKKECCIQ